MNRSMFRMILVAVVSCALGIVVASAVASWNSQQLREKLEANETVYRQLQDSSAKQQRQLEERIKRLEVDLNRQLTETAMAKPEIAETNDAGDAGSTTNKPTRVATEQRHGGSGSSWTERIRQQDPERYKQMVADREQRHKEMDDWYNNTQAQLQARAQSPATPDEPTVVTQISDTLQKLNDLRQQMGALRELPEDQRQTQMAQIIPELQATYQQLSTLRDQDRTIQFQNLATQLGLKGDSAQTLVDTIPQIYKNTQYTSPHSGGWPGSGGSGGTSGSGSTVNNGSPKH